MAVILASEGQKAAGVRSARHTGPTATAEVCRFPVYVDTTNAATQPRSLEKMASAGAAEGAGERRWRGGGGRGAGYLQRG